ncbi:hypothetical protein I550_1878 [Mycobacterium intracellulare 1956]|uniref:Uncharacterized protein n=3 Tax=Mycobacterium intracellulare TaxID=1767 RepID=X8CU00_MYCIT|nr:hypothetical protein I548_4839 [Mycobacterium intracellulare]EUA58735.1 hypothetical protein I550_1878 [Mycobacterium intracellulare 1956]
MTVSTVPHQAARRAGAPLDCRRTKAPRRRTGSGRTAPVRAAVEPSGPMPAVITYLQ